jgi:hypothetical protein
MQANHQRRKRKQAISGNAHETSQCKESGKRQNLPAQYRQKTS